MTDILMGAYAGYFDPQDSARAEAMVRALVPEGCEVVEEYRSEPNPEADVMRQRSYFGVKWRVER